MIILELITTEPEHAAVKSLKGFVLSGTVVKISKNVLPPKPVVMALIALGIAFPK
jgi:hypothetical protein